MRIRSRALPLPVVNILSIGAIKMSQTKDSPSQTRRDNWDDGDVRLLIDIWADDRVQADLEGTGRNITIYRRIAERLNRAVAAEAVEGVRGRTDRTAESCRTKIKGLQQSYKKVIDNNK